MWSPTLSRPQGAPSPMPVSRWPRSGRYGRRKGVGRHLVPRKRSRAGFGMGDREGRPYAGLVAELFGCRGDACRRPRYRARGARHRPCRFPDGLVRVGTGRRKGVGRHLVPRKRSRAGFGMGDREGRPYAGLVAELFGCRGDACRRPRLSSPTLSRPQGAPSPMPVSRWPRSGRYGRRKGVGRHLVPRKRSRAGFGMGDREGRGMGDREGRPYAGLVAELFGV